MKKIIAISMVLMMLFIILAACTQRQGDAEESWPAAVSETPVNVTESPAIANGLGFDNVPTSPSKSYAKYIDMKGTAYDRINAKLEENEDLHLSVGMSLLPITFVDLSLIPLTVLSEEIKGAQAGLAKFGMTGVTIERNDQDYSITYSDQDGNRNIQTCVYDPATDSLQSCIANDAGKETMFFEYVKVGNGYVSQYFMRNEDGYSKITSFFNESSLAAFGVETTDTKPDSIFKTGNQTVDFVKNDDLYFILKDNSLTVSENGQEKMY
ncbi:MAG: hypothetical protein ACOX8Q_01215 [Christensenellales bacterium]|jgi:hypothetical protein